MAKKDDPKAQEYATTITNLTLMKAQVDKLESDVFRITQLLGQSFILLNTLSEIVKVLEERTGNQ